MYSMSDEELAQLDFNEFVATNEEVAEPEEAEEKPEDTEEADESEAGNAEPEIDDESEEPDDTETQEVDADEEPAETPEANVFDNADEGTQEEADADTDDTEDNAEPEEVEDTKSGKSVEELQKFYDEITAEFKANGKMMSISNPSDIKTLVQQGINYSKRMAEMKPGMNVLRTLEEHGLMDNSKISYLIDLHNKDPKAIAKLVKESGIEAYDLDTEDTADYQPVNKVVEQSKFQEVVAELKSSPNFGGLLKTISSSWDEESHSFVINNPNVLRVLTEQDASGLFTKITDTVEYERSVGRMQDIPFIEAYSIVEQQMQSGANKPAEKAPVMKAPRPKSKAASNNSKKRKVAAPNSGNSVKEEKFNPLTVSDEEIMKMAELHKLY